ncbi:Abhydrolase domain-containing protein mpaH [Hypsizygus marmoreus]|uniref:Abhydrolase domain-containing protein mpaH n=1 Tax=Hypsizygus marmoreus TaxID=39966 RepID=A0A369JIT2_HYPMA|nr:Abhydrolase domain-containing protein mpaH [Hypsizygus marmoreus]
MLSQSIKDIPRNGYPLFTTAKRYWLPELEVHASDPEALTLILLHGTSFHKETWEPSLEHLLKLSIQPGSFVKIREAWALDCPNHGEAGHLNEPMLNLPEYRNNYTCEKYAKAVHRFLSAGPEHGARIDFRKRNLVGIGHSLGGNAMLILQHLEPRIPFTSLIIIEPMLSPAGPQHLQKLRSILVKGAHERRDVWPDSEQAMKALTKRERTNKWDPRITQLFVKFAIVPHPGSYIEETPYTGVTLACTRDQEAAMYRDADGPTKPVLDLNKACASKPVHIILGGVNDFIPRRVHEAILDSKSGRNYASKTTIQGVGHLVPQEAPEKLGAAMFEALASNVGQPFKSKL